MALRLFDENGMPLGRRRFAPRELAREPAAEPPAELGAPVIAAPEQQESSPPTRMARMAR